MYIIQHAIRYLASRRAAAGGRASGLPASASPPGPRPLGRAADVYVYAYAYGLKGGV